MACVDCATGSLHAGTPSGKVTTIHDLPTYVAEPPAGTEAKAVVVIISDAFGWELPNNRILADNFAKKGGFEVFLPDFFDGHALSADLLDSIETFIGDKPSGIFGKVTSFGRTAVNFAPYLYAVRNAVTVPRIYKFFNDLRAATTSHKVFTAGYCWGGKYSVLLNGPGTPYHSYAPDLVKPNLVDASFTAHPSKLEIPGDADQVDRPLSVALGTEDKVFKGQPAEEMKVILEKKGNCEFRWYDGAKHGFAIRGDEKDEKVAKQGTEAEDQALAWFEKHLNT